MTVPLVAGSLTCGGDDHGDNIGPGPRPAALEEVAGDGQQGFVGQTLPDSLVVRVRDAQGQPLSGVAVAWSVGGGGSVSSASDTTGPDGQSAVQRTLGAEAGMQTTRAAAADLAFEFTAVAQEAGPARVVIVTQPSSAAENGVTLAQQPAVRLDNGAGQPMGAGIPVTVSVQGATLSGTTTVATDANGSAQFTDLALSGAAGDYRLTFSAPQLPPVRSGTISLATVSAEGGVWSSPFDWPIVAVHLILLPNGRMLSIGRVGVPQLWDPATGEFTPAPAPAWLFCAGHTLLADGRVLVAGGHISDSHGLPNITLFSGNGTWTSDVVMARGRWYPTTTLLGNGDVLITAGRDEDSANVDIPEVWSNGTIRRLTGAPQDLPYYPRAFLTADGRIYVAGPANNTRFLDVSGNGIWTGGPPRLGGPREYGSAVMYDDGKILYAGGSRTTNTAETIDLSQPNPQWRWTSPMAFARRHLNLTVLPTGEVLATGGVAGTTFDDVTKGVHAAELWNPATGQWRTLKSNAITRGYHSTSLLLPDGRILHSGSGDGAGAPNEHNAEFFSPPYLFRGARPTISSAPADVAYGQQFRIETPQAASIANVSLIRLGAVTHAFDQNQRFQRLAFTADASGLTVTAPSSSNRAPPGHYMVFILNGSDVPSVARIIRIH